MKLLRLTSLLATASAFAPTELVTAAPRAVRAPRAPVVSASVASLTRRSALAAALSLLAATPPRAAFASQDPNDLNRFKKGLEGVNYLLDNWEKETTDPISGEMAPDRVRIFLGLRTTDHPLFQVDKLLVAAQKKLPDDVDFDLWIDAVEGWNSHVNKVNELAYTSSFGEYNPGGGKGQIAKYLELARGEVVLCRDSLKTIVGLLQI